MRVSYVAIVLLGLGTLSTPARATPVAFAFTATVVGLGDHNGALAAAGITVGAAALGVFGWDTDTPDSVLLSIDSLQAIPEPDTSSVSGSRGS